MNPIKLFRAITLFGLTLGASAAHAVPSYIASNIQPLITAGAPPDTPAARVDPNLASSPFSGVVSVNIRYSNGDSYICSGAMISRWHAVSAGHCVDSNGNGSVIDINQAGNDVRVVFNASSDIGSPGRSIITANRVDIHPDYAGFGNCPGGVAGFCVNDDLAIIRLSAPAPDEAKVYKIFNGQVFEGSEFTMVGYGTSGDGWDGYTVGPAFRIKRSGKNVFDFAEGDDESNFASGSAEEVWYADFDGVGPDGTVYDTFCDPAVLGVAICGASLGNDIEANIGGGDSGGPSFILVGNEYQLVANNTFGIGMGFLPNGGFGDGMGGVLLDPYRDWISMLTVAEPGSLALSALALGALCGRRRAARGKLPS